MSSTSFAIRLDTSASAQLKDKSYPVVLQVIFQRNGKATKQSMRTGLTCHIKLWDKKYHEFALEHEEEESLNDELRNIRRTAIKINKEHFRDGKRDFNYAKFVDIFRMKDQGDTVFSFIDMLIDDITQGKRKLTKKKLSVGTARSYDNLKSALRKYTDNEAVTFDDIDEDWLERLEQRMRGEDVKTVVLPPT